MLGYYAVLEMENFCEIVTYIATFPLTLTLDSEIIYAFGMRSYKASSTSVLLQVQNSTSWSPPVGDDVTSMQPCSAMLTDGGYCLFSSDWF